MATLSKLLIANRGEIAVRIIRACRELGIQTAAVYSQVDEQAMHVRMADQAMLIGPASPTESYLDAERLLAAALATGADAVHPGYGFLAENAAFAQAVRDAGLIFVGPPAAAIEIMADKGQARQSMISAGVPVVPGFDADSSDETLSQAADELGFPVLVKAAAGGGGTGMRVVTQRADLAAALAAARREAAHAFGNDTLILEKYIQGARHIEFQILADEHGAIMHLNERECSVQRRHQKVIEECPSPYLDAALREQMGAAAVAAAQAVDYANAGTIEFIVEPASGTFYFLEMNTRLQVEHPVTELTTGLDLVQLQLQIAQGAALADLIPEPPQAPFGHAIECRLYAEDPGQGFLPSAGRVLRFRVPTGPGLRLDAGIETGDTVSPYYDPMLAKFIVHAADRDQAIQRMRHWLQQSALMGVDHNIGFLIQVLDHPVFRQGQVTTDFVENRIADLLPSQDLPLPVFAAAALADRMVLQAVPAQESFDAPAAPKSPWETLSGFRLSGSRAGQR